MKLPLSLIDLLSFHVMACFNCPTLICLSKYGLPKLVSIIQLLNKTCLLLHTSDETLDLCMSKIVALRATILKEQVGLAANEIPFLPPSLPLKPATKVRKSKQEELKKKV